MRYICIYEIPHHMYIHICTCAHICTYMCVYIYINTYLYMTFCTQVHDLHHICHPSGSHPQAQP